MFTHPAMAIELARQRHRDLVACADRYRLSRQVNHPSTLSERLRSRASLLHRHPIWRARGSVSPSGRRVPQPRSLETDHAYLGLDPGGEALHVAGVGCDDRDRTWCGLAYLADGRVDD